MFKNLTLIACLLYSATCGAALSDATIDRLLKASGAEVQIRLIPDAMREFGRSALGQNISSDNDNGMDIEPIVSQLASPEGFFKEIRSRLNAGLTEADAALLLAWFDSPQGQRITRAEEESSTPAAIRDMRRRAASLMLNERRVATAKTINTLNDSNEMFLALQEQMIFRIIDEIRKVNKSKTQGDINELKATLDQNRGDRLAMLEQGSIISLVYTYKKLEYSLIDEYIKFLETPAARKFSTAIKEGMRAELERGTEAMAQALALEYKRMEDEDKKAL